MNTIRIIFFYWVFLLFPGAISGKDIYFRSLGMKDGLSQLSSISIWQDRIGRMWFGNDAANCYNGTTTEVFRFSEFFPTIEDANIHNICGTDSTVFLLAENRIISIDLLTDQPVLTGITASAICIVENQLYAVEDHAIFRYDSQSAKKEVLFTNDNYLFNHITPINKNEFWIGTTSGLLKVHLDKKEIVSSVCENESIVAQFLDSDQRLWFGTKSCLAAVVSPDGTLAVIESSQNRFAPYIHSFSEDTRGTVWIGTLAGIYKVNYALAGMPELESEQPLMPELSVTALYTDKQGTLWIGSYYGDIRYGNVGVNNFRVYVSDESVADRLHGVVLGAMTEDKEENLYVATEGSGINVIDNRKGTIRHITKSSHQLPDNKVRSLWYDKQFDRLFISAYRGGLVWFNKKSDRLEKIDSPFLQNIPQLTVEEIIPYKDLLVLQSSCGIYKMDRQTFQVSYLLEDSVLRHKCTGNIRTIHIDDKDRLWVSSLEEGLFTVDLKTQKFLQSFGDGLQKESRIPSAVNSICGDSQTGLFMSTLNSGILFYNEESNRFVSYTQQDHLLLSNICYNLSWSAYGDLVVTTDKGVSILDVTVKKKIVSAYHIHLNDLFQINALSGDCGIYVSPYSKDIYVGALCGLYAFNERELTQTNVDYSLFFSSITVNNQPLTPGKTEILTQNMAFTQQLNLPFDQNTISLSFSTTNYILSNCTQYEYKMIGLDDLWISAYSWTITYPSLRPGRYRLVIREVDDPQKEISLEIVVGQPFWLSLPMILLYAALIILVVVWLIRFNRTKMLLAASLEMEKKEIERIETMNKEKQQFLTAISNEFRTPLTIIVTLLNKISEENAFAGKGRIGKILKQALYLQDLITRLLAFNDGEQQEWILNADYLPESVTTEEETERGHTYTMLIVDPDDEIRGSLKDMFSFAYRLIEARNGEEGLQLAGKEGPDIILSEISLVGLSGIELCKMIKSNIETLHIPVVLMTFSPSVEQQVQSIHCGANDYIVKPFQVELLLHKCNSLVRNNRKVLAKYSKQKAEEKELPLLAINMQKQKFLDTAIHILENNLDNTDFDIAQWSRGMGVGRTNLFNQIKTITGMTPNDYILSFKIDKAKIFLAEEPDCPVAEIAYRLGYSDPVYFSRTFKKIVGTSPLQYRKDRQAPLDKKEKE